MKNHYSLEILEGDSGPEIFLREEESGCLLNQWKNPSITEILRYIQKNETNYELND